MRSLQPWYGINYMDSNRYRIIGIGWQAFISGVFKGAKKLGITPSNASIRNVTENARKFINNITNVK